MMRKAEQAKTKGFGDRALFESILKTTSSGIAIFDTNRGLVYLNSVFKKLLRVGSNLSGKRLFEVWAQVQKDNPRVKHEVSYDLHDLESEVFEKKRTVVSFAQIRGEKNTIIELTAAPIKEGSQIKGMLVRLRDISKPIALKEAKEKLEKEVSQRTLAEDNTLQLFRELKKEREKIDTLVSNIPGVVWETYGTREKQRVDYISDYLEKMLGYLMQDWVSDRSFWVKIIHPMDRKSVFKAFRESFFSKKPGKIRSRWIAKDGRILWIESQFRPILNERKVPIGFRGISLDVSEQKKKEDGQEFLIKSSVALASSLDFEKNLKLVAQVAVENIADWCVVDLKSDSIGINRLHVAHKKLKMTPAAKAYSDKYPFDPSQAEETKIYKTGKSDLYSFITDEILKGAIKDQEQLRLLRKIGLKSMMRVPLKAHKKILGAMTFISSDDSVRYNEEDLRIAEELGRRAAFTIENSTLHQEIKDSRDRLNIILKGIADGITVQDKLGRLVYANDAAAKLIGFSSAKKLLETPPVEIVKRFEILNEKGRVLPLTRLPGRLALKGKFVPEIVLQFRTLPEGKFRWSSVKASPVLDENGKPTFAINIFRDITQQKTAEQILRRSRDQLESMVKARTKELAKTNESLKKEVEVRKETEKRLEEEKNKIETIYKTAQEGLVLYDAKGRVVSINPALKKLLGAKQAIVGASRTDISKNREKYFKFRQERNDNSLKTQRLVYSGQSVHNVLIRVLVRPVRYVEANYDPIWSKSGEVVGMIASFTDVTQLKKQAEEISQNLSTVEKEKNRLEAVFESVEEGVVIYDKNYKIIHANSACETLSGYTLSEIIGSKGYEIFSCQDKNGNSYPDFDPTAKIFSTQEAIPYDEHVHVTKEGKKLWVGVSYTPIFDEQGNIEQIVAVSRDITAMKRLERAKSEFVSLASHELRTPLTVITGYLSLLLNGDFGDLAVPEKRKMYINAIAKVQNETQRLTKLVEELLNVTRIEDGRLKLNVKRISVLELLDEIVNEFKPIANAKNISFEFKNHLNGYTESRYVFGDKDKLKQVLVNLVENAIKFTPDGGKVVVECKGVSESIYIQIQDTGIGIAPNILPRIFEKFQQGGSSYLKENKGTGLGLFIVKSLVEMHNGKIWVDSRPGKGSKFTFSLPSIATH